MCLVTGESTHVDAIKMFYTQSAQRRGEEKDRLLAGISVEALKLYARKSESLPSVSDTDYMYTNTTAAPAIDTRHTTTFVLRLRLGPSSTHTPLQNLLLGVSAYSHLWEGKSKNNAVFPGTAAQVDGC